MHGNFFHKHIQDQNDHDFVHYFLSVKNSFYEIEKIMIFINSLRLKDNLH